MRATGKLSAFFVSKFIWLTPFLSFLLVPIIFRYTLFDLRRMK